MERIEEARTTAAMQPEPSARGAAHRPQSNSPAAPRFHHPTQYTPRVPISKPRECTREPRGWVRSETNSPGTTVS